MKDDRLYLIHIGERELPLLITETESMLQELNEE